MKSVYMLALFFFTACQQGNHQTDTSDVLDSETTNEHLEQLPEPSKNTIHFLWRENKYDETLQDTFNSIIINLEFCEKITDVERAALAYVATFIGNECSWDGDYKEDRSNLKCKILTALNLGYQCSDKHLGFLRQMFENDSGVLEELAQANCPTTPEGATIQDSFDDIFLTSDENKIRIFFKATGINFRERDSWNWTETDFFEFNKDQIRLVKKDKSKLVHKEIYIGE